MSYENDTQAAIDAGKLIGALENEVIKDQHGVQWIRTGPGGELTELAKPLDFPKRKEGTTNLHTPADFCAWVNAQAEAETVIFADSDAHKFTGVIDYHQGTEGRAGWRKFTGTHTLKHSEAWKQWTAIDGKGLDQVELGEFLEERITEIGAPDGRKLIECVLNLKVNTAVKFSSAVSLRTGEIALHYTETQEQGSNRAGIIELPESLTLVMPVYFGGQPVQIEAKLRVRCREGQATFVVKLMNRKEVEDAAFVVETEVIRRGCPNLPLFIGSP